MKKGDVGMAKHFSKKYGHAYPVSAIWFCQDSMPDATTFTASKTRAVRVQQNEYLINYARLVGLWLTCRTHTHALFTLAI